MMAFILAMIPPSEAAESNAKYIAEYEKAISYCKSWEICPATQASNVCNAVCADTWMRHNYKEGKIIEENNEPGIRTRITPIANGAVYRATSIGRK